MIITRTNQTVLVLCILFSSISGQVTLSVTYESDTMTDVYQYEPLRVMCKADGMTAESFRLAFNLTKTGVVDSSISCLRGSSISFSSVALAELQALLIQEPTNEDCGSLPGEKLSVTLNATSQLSDYKIRCDYYINPLGSGIGDTTLEISMPEIKVAPQGLTMSITPEPVQEGEEFEAVCESTGEASPISSYEYDILRNGQEVTSITGRYTPTKEDREGFTVKCRDTSHTNWKIDDDIMKTKSLLPQYIEIGGNGIDAPAVSLNPEWTNTLTCNIIAHTGAVIRYTWTSTVESENGGTDRELMLSPRKDVQDGVTEVITCVGSVEGLSTSKIITWTITWTMLATTTPTPTPTSSTSKAGLYVGVTAGVVIVGIIVIIVAVVCWRKRKAADGNKYDRDLALNENGEFKPKPQGKGRTPSKHSKDSTPLNQQHNDKPEIIYSDVQAISKPHPNTAMVRPHQRVDKPPEVEYSSIDFLKTDAQKGKPVVPTGPEYESVERGVHGEFNKPKQPRAPPRASVPRNQAPPPPRSSPPGDLDI